MSNAEVRPARMPIDSVLVPTAIPAAWRATAWYVLTGCAALALYMLRMLVHPVEMQWTMAWNGFLAITPLFFAWLVERTDRSAGRWRWTAIPCAIAWLLLLPNSLYLLTDLVHLGKRTWFWLDLPTYAVLAFCGIQCALLSFVVISPWVRRWSGWGFPLVVAAILILAMMGIHAGRFVRLNSWEMVTSPWRLIASVPAHFDQASAGGLLYGYGAFAILLVLAYMPLRHLEADRR
jgi:uncharacterized membrane protein